MKLLISAIVGAIFFLAFINLANAYAQAQVEIQQSESTNVNGVHQSIEQNNGKTIIHVNHGTLTISGDQMKYCIQTQTQKCSLYKLESNGTILRTG